MRTRPTTSVTRSVLISRDRTLCERKHIRQTYIDLNSPKIYNQNVRGLRTKFDNVRMNYPIFGLYDVIMLSKT